MGHGVHPCEHACEPNSDAATGHEPDMKRVPAAAHSEDEEKWSQPVPEAVTTETRPVVSSVRRRLEPAAARASGACFSSVPPPLEA